jgi:hypothetical protein
VDSYQVWLRNKLDRGILVSGSHRALNNLCLQWRSVMLF